MVLASSLLQQTLFLCDGEKAAPALPSKLLVLWAWGLVQALFRTVAMMVRSPSSQGSFSISVLIQPPASCFSNSPALEE